MDIWGIILVVVIEIPALIGVGWVGAEIEDRTKSKLLTWIWILTSSLLLMSLLMWIGTMV